MDFEYLVVLLLFAVNIISLAFLVITGLMVTVIFSRTCGKHADRNDSAAPAQSLQTGAPVAAAPRTPQTASDDDEIMAVISATIAAVCGDGARVVDIGQSAPVQIARGSTWRSAARIENFEGF
ncbi:MAG: OadG family protein [Synergistaceae bacterium]|jgi:hypothetical protein|nr:OadG family protein [Synergistaceae bacterium]